MLYITTIDNLYFASPYTYWAANHSFADGILGFNILFNILNKSYLG